MGFIPAALSCQSLAHNQPIAAHIMKSLNAGDGDVARSAKRLVLKPEDLGLDPLHHVTKPQVVVQTSDTSVGEVGTGKSCSSRVS